MALLRILPIVPWETFRNDPNEDGPGERPMQLVLVLPGRTYDDIGPPKVLLEVDPIPRRNRAKRMHPRQKEMMITQQPKSQPFDDPERQTHRSVPWDGIVEHRGVLPATKHRRHKP